jgi:hypothetical protein
MPSLRFFLSFLRITTICLLLFLSSVAICRSDDQAKDPALVRAQNDKDIAEAEAARYKAELGQITATLPKGTTSAQGLNIEGTIIAYRAARDAAEKIATDAQNKKATTIVFFSSKELNGQLVLKSFLLQTEILDGRIKNELSRPLTLLTRESGNLAKCDKPGASKKVAQDEIEKTKKRIGIPPLLVIDTALQVLSLFKVDRTVTGHDITLDDFAIYTLVANSLISKNIPVVYPACYYPSESNWSSTEAYKRFTLLLENSKALDKAAYDVGKTKTELLQSAEQVKSNACKSALYAHDVAVVDDRLSLIKTVQSIVGQIIAGLTKSDDQSGLTLIQTLMTAGQLSTRLKSAHLLQVKPISAGGSTLTTTNVFGSKLSFSGGVVISYMLFDDEGKLVSADSIPVYGGYFPAHKMK